jgi:hypothetical protein
MRIPDETAAGRGAAVASCEINCFIAYWHYIIFQDYSENITVIRPSERHKLVRAIAPFQHNKKRLIVNPSDEAFYLHLSDGQKN